MNATLTPPEHVGTVHEQSFASRMIAVVRLHFVNPTVIVWLPLMILGIILAVNWTIWWLLVTYAFEGDSTTGVQITGGSLFIFIYLMIVAMQAMNQTFQYALGMGATRRDYFLGTAITFVALAAGWSLLIGALGWIEEATRGWGLDGQMFAGSFFGTDGALARVGYVFLLLLAFLALGALSGAIFVRWRGLGVTFFWVGLAVLLVAAVALVTITSSWGALGDFFGALGIGGAYWLSLVLTVIAGICGYLALRKATPRS